MLELCRVCLPLAAAACFAWGVWQCAVRTLFPAGPLPRVQRTLPPGLWRPALFCLAAGALVQAVLVAYSCAQSGGAPLGQALEMQFYGNTDARHYIDLAQYGYGAGEDFPEHGLILKILIIS